MASSLAKHRYLTLVATAGAMDSLSGVNEFLRSKALGNVFRSLGLFLGAWIWYVINTNTYMPPDYDD